MSSVTPDQILSEGSKERVIHIRPWVPAQLSDVWQAMRKNLEQTMKRKDKQGRVQTSQVVPASSHNQT